MSVLKGSGRTGSRLSLDSRVCAADGKLLLLRYGAGILLVGNHEHQDFGALVRAWVARGRVDRGRRLIKSITSLQRAGRLAVDRELVGPFDDVPKGVVSRVPMASAARAGLSIQEADPDLPTR